MTITDALRRSKETGESFNRDSAGDGYCGWIKYFPKWEFTHLRTEDLMADDWVALSEGINMANGSTIAAPNNPDNKIVFTDSGSIYYHEEGDQDLIDSLIDELRLQNESHENNVARIRAEILTRFIALRGVVAS